MTSVQKSAIVAIESASGGATGFIAKLNEKVFLVSNTHVLGAIKNPRISTLGGDTLKLGRLYAARNHDIAIVEIIELPDSLQPLEIMDEVEVEAKTSDKIIVCGNSRAKGTMLDTKGEIVGIGPRKVETNSPFYEGNSGSPVLHLKSGKVIAVASYVEFDSKKSSRVSEASRADKKSAIKGDARYFSYRIDSVKKWDFVTFNELKKQNDKIESYKKKLKTIFKSFPKIKADKNIDTSLTDYQEYRDIVQEYQRDNLPSRSQASRRRAKYDFFEKMHKLCKMELQKLKTVKMLSTFDERKEEIIASYTYLEDFFAKAMQK